MKIPAYSYLFIAAVCCMLPAACLILYNIALSLWGVIVRLYLRCGIIDTVVVCSAAIGLLILVVLSIINWVNSPWDWTDDY